MKQKRKWPVFWMILLGVNIAFIWGNSLMPREVSSAFSKLVGHILSLLLPVSEDLSEGQGQGNLRKIAHFLEFCSLGFIMFRCGFFLCRKKWQQLCVPIAAGVAVAALDETIQLMIPGRGSQLRDVCIDSGGVFTGVIVAILLFRLFRKKTCTIPNRKL